jgi:hypothetical protein
MFRTNLSRRPVIFGSSLTFGNVDVHLDTPRTPRIRWIWVYRVGVAEQGTAANKATPYNVIIKGDGVNIDKSLDSETAARVIELVVGGPSVASQRSKPRKAKRPKKAAGGTSKGTRRKASPGVVKDLSLHPVDKPSFVEFADEKKPANHHEKQAVIVAWLIDSAGLDSGITPDHINTCYKAAHWKRPASFDKNLQLNSSRWGWLDTADMGDLKLTVSGEDYVSHNLPPSD